MTTADTGVTATPVHLFNEQFVVKVADRGLRFGWHQDSGFIGYPYGPYLTCWIPRDDVDAENGSVWLLPYSRAGPRAAVEHVLDPETNDLIGYVGDDPGDADPPGREHRLLLQHRLPPQRTEPDRTNAPRVRCPILIATDPRRGRLRPAAPGHSADGAPPAVLRALSLAELSSARSSVALLHAMSA